MQLIIKNKKFIINFLLDNTILLHFLSPKLRLKVEKCILPNFLSPKGDCRFA